MLLTLTDHLTCPRCGPSAGLVLLMQQAEERRVGTGELGCPVCRARYPIAGGVADLRGDGPGGGSAPGPGPGAAGGHGTGQVPPPERAAADPVRIAGLMGLEEGRGFALLDGPGALAAASRLAELVPGYEIVVIVEAGEAGRAAGLPVSALLAEGPLPVRSGGMRAVAALGRVPDAERVRELMRICRPTGRFVVDLGEAREAEVAQAAQRLEAAGAAVRGRDASGVVAVVV